MIDRPVEDVWRFISNPECAPAWGRGVSDIEITSDPPIGLGTTLRLRMSGSKVEARVMRFAPAKSLTVEFTGGPVRGSKLTFSVEEVDGRTILTRDLEMKLNGVWRLMYPILTRRETRDRDLAINNVKRLVEAESGEV